MANEDITLVVTRAKSAVFPSFGRCIYCKGEGGGLPLTREHVIPRGLGGGIIIRGASCEDCRGKTAKVEQSLRTNFGIHRLTEGFPSDHDGGPETLPITYYDADDVPFETEETIAEYPRILQIPWFRKTPRFFRDMPPSNVSYFERLRLYIAPNTVKRDFFYKPIFDHNSFHRFLAKMAHGYAVAHLGIDGFKFYLYDLIAGNDAMAGRQYIGRPFPEGSFGPKLKRLHRISLHSYARWGIRYHTVTIQLFANIYMGEEPKAIGTPLYWVIVGESPANNSCRADPNSRQ
jgi:hypothetical protein